MSLATDVRAYADTALVQGKTVLSQAVTANLKLVADAPKPAYAVLGAADLVAAKLTHRVETLPSDAVAGVSKAQQGGLALLSRTTDDALARVTELRGRLDAGLGSVTALPTVARKAGQNYLNDAKQIFGQLTARGEAKATELRQDPRLNRVLGDLTDAAGTTVAPVARTVRSKVQPVAKSAFDAVPSVEVEVVQTTPAKRPARKTTTRSAAVKPADGKLTARTSTTKAPVKTAAKATKAPATKSAPRKRAADK